MKDFWTGIDAVCVINLDHRRDRWEKLKSDLAAFIPEEKLYRISAAYGINLPGYKTHRLFHNCTDEESRFWAGRAGCVLSHTNCLKLALERGWNRTMILEDDALFLDNMKGAIGDMLSSLLNRSTWDMVYPGFAPYDDKGVLLKETQSERGEIVRAYRILGPLNAHCYIVSRKLLKKAIPLLPNINNVWRWVAMHLSYDSWIANNFGKRASVHIIGLYPIVCVQRESYSDIETTIRSSTRGALKILINEMSTVTGAPQDPGALPIKPISPSEFQARYTSLSFLCKKAAKILLHYALGVFYYIVGFRKFKVSVAEAGWLGSLKAALRDLQKRRS